MRLEINDDDFRALPKQTFRAAAYFLLHVIGDIPDDETVVPTGTSAAPSAPPVAPAATAPAVNTAVASAAANTSPSSAAPTLHTAPSATATHAPANIPPPPPPPPPAPTSDGDYDDETGEPHSNVVNGNFPQAGNVPPPPPSVDTAASNTPPPSLPATGAAAATGVVSAEYDSAGMPWDARIHQKAKGKKKDNTWKLIKGIDPAVVQAVTAELAARKGASAPVSLPQNGNTVPLPPVANVPAPPGVPAPPAGASSTVPVPPSPAVGTMGAYRGLIDKITDLTRAAKITPQKVSEICQSHGAPSLMALNSMQEQKSARDPALTIIEAVSRDIDAAALGLL